jgi:uncharacterized protein with von Willebrand factor type A (vWA) domain
MVKIENNLKNITTRDPVYNITAERITDLTIETLPEDLKSYSKLLKSPHFKIISTDNYFIHYSNMPMLKNYNEDKILNEVLEFQKEYMKTDKYANLRSITTLDDEMSLLYSKTFTTILLKKLIEKMPDEKRKQLLQKLQSLPLPEPPSASESSDDSIPSIPIPPDTPMPPPDVFEPGTPGSGTPSEGTAVDSSSSSNENLEEELDNMISEIMNELKQQGIDIKEVLRETQKEAQETSENLNNIKRIFGRSAGKESGMLTFLSQLANEIMKKKVNMKIIEVAGKIIDKMPLFVKIKKEKDQHGDELAGYKLTKNIERALPRELSLPDELFFYKLASSGFLSREKMIVKEGAYYVLIDKSGSMDGEKTIWARAVALALLKLAKEKKRRLFMRFFDFRVYDLADDSDIAKLMTMILTVRSDGGTNIDEALRTALRDLEKLKEFTNTIIIITDGEDKVETKPEDLKKLNASLVAVMIEGENDMLKKLAEESGGQYLSAEPSPDGALKIVDLLKK